MRGSTCQACGEVDIGITLTKARPPLSSFEAHNPYLAPVSTPVEDVVVLKSPVIARDCGLTYKRGDDTVALGPVPMLSLSHYIAPNSSLSYLQEENEWTYTCIWALKNGYPDYVETWCRIAASVLKRSKINVDYIVRALGSGELRLSGDENEPLDLMCRAMARPLFSSHPVYVPNAIVKAHLMQQTKTLSRDARIVQIVEGNIYRCDASKLQGSNKTILVVDDVCTSGSTLFGIRQAILTAKPSAKVIFLVAAENPGKIELLAQRACQENNALVGRCFGALMPKAVLPNMSVHVVNAEPKYRALTWLAKTENAPARVYCMGNLELLKSRRNVAIVGSRDCSLIGKKLAKATAAFLAKNGFCIVSGLADGIDSAAHLGSFAVSDRTIAVVPSLTDLNDQLLACELLKRGGLLLSENPPGTTTTGALLVARNRIQTGLSLVTFIIEAELGSGSMHTASFSLKQKRPILCPNIACYSDQAMALAGIDQVGVGRLRSGIDTIDSLPFTLEELGPLSGYLGRRHAAVEKK